MKKIKVEQYNWKKLGEKPRPAKQYERPGWLLTPKDDIPQTSAYAGKVKLIKKGVNDERKAHARGKDRS